MGLIILSKSKKNKNNLYTSIEKLRLLELLEEVKFDIIFLRDKCKIQETIFLNALEKKPCKLFWNKYDKWVNRVEQLKKDYEKTINDYTEECQYYDELIQLLENLDK